MRSEQRLDRVQPFAPLRPVPRRRMIARAVVAPFIWVAALVLGAVVLKRTNAIELGLLIAAAALAVSLAVLSLLRFGRNRERTHYADRR